MTFKISRVLDMLYPRRCPVCDGLLGGKEPLICRKCAAGLQLLEGPVCLRCGKPLERKDQEYCRDCGKKRHSYERGFAPFSYRGMIQESMMRFKYGGRAEYAKFYAAAVMAYGKRLLEYWSPDVMIPVPIHRERLLKRGYNQAEELAVQLSSMSGIPVERRAVLRIKNTKAQKELNDVERKKNLTQAFSIVKGYSPPRRILLVDDIYTTGSTIDTLALLLKKNGAQSVYFACVCVSPGDT